MRDNVFATNNGRKKNPYKTDKLRKQTRTISVTKWPVSETQNTAISSMTPKTHKEIIGRITFSKLNWTKSFQKMKISFEENDKILFRRNFKKLILNIYLVGNLFDKMNSTNSKS